jgi:deoxycytidine triphosphate deaminase
MSGVTATSETSAAQAPGGVLSDGAIRAEIEAGRLIVGDTFDPHSLRPASYDLTAAPKGLIGPDGVSVAPHVERTERRVVLDPGDAAMFSTKELFCMPGTIAGNITIKNSFATEGLMLLSGGLIDPTYGEDSERSGCRLFLHVANIGRLPIEIRPGQDHIARVQFLRLCGPEDPEREPIACSVWEEQKRPSLGFLTDLKELKEKVDRSEARSQQVILLGAVVLAIALIGAEFSTILSIVTNKALGKELHKAWPASSHDGLVWVLLLVGVPLAIYAVVELIGKGRNAAKRRSSRLPVAR